MAVGAIPIGDSEAYLDGVPSEQEVVVAGRSRRQERLAFREGLVADPRVIGNERENGKNTWAHVRHSRFAAHGQGLADVGKRVRAPLGQAMQLSSEGQRLRLEAARPKLPRERPRPFDVLPRAAKVAHRVPTGIGGVVRNDLGPPMADPHRRFDSGKCLAQRPGCITDEPPGKRYHRPVGDFDTTEPVLAG